MSDTGFRATGQQGNGQQSADNGIRTNDRDPWGQPIKQPAARANADGKDTTDDGNDDGIDDKDIDNIWNDVKAKKKDGEGDPPPNNQQQQQQVDPAKQLTDYFKSVGLGEFVIPDDIKNEIKEGNFDNFNGKILELVRNAHSKALSGASTLIDAKVAAAVEQATKGTKEYIAGKEAVDALNKALPYTKDKTIGPVAQTIMQRLLTRGATQDEAIEGVRLWGKKFVNLADPDREVNPNRNQGYGRGGSNTGEKTNWIDMLSPKRQ